MNIDVSFRNIRFNLNYTLRKKEEYKRELISFDEENYGFFLVRIATECMLLLDQMMEAVWKKVADLKNKKPYLYFPVLDEKDNKDKLEAYLKRIRLEKIKEDMPELLEIIMNVQPFECGRSWLFHQYHIANERHSDPQFVYEYRPKKALYIHMPSAVGEEFKSFMRTQNGDTQFIHIRRYGVPDRKPPEARIKSEEEAIDFIENCISGTNKLIFDMIDCFERKL